MRDRALCFDVAHWFRGLTVMTADSDSASEGSTPSETFVFGVLPKLLFILLLSWFGNRLMI